MANLEIKHFFTYNRFPENDLKMLLSILYLPIGLIVLLIRSILVLILYVLVQVMPESKTSQKFLNNWACFCFGISVTVDDIKLKENVSVFISNYISIFDHLAVNQALGNIVPLNKVPFENLHRVKPVIVGNNGDSTEVGKQTIDKLTENKKISVLFCPEEIPTNGRALLKFNDKYFNYFDKVQPICITVKRPLLSIALSTIGSKNISDLLYFMYSPFTNYKIKLLPSLEKKDLSADQFADLVRKNLAAGLKVEASTYAAADLIEWSKRYLKERCRVEPQRVANRIATALPDFTNPEILRMATQVKEVVPQVPMAVIYKDLAITRNIDSTITNIFEGRIRYIPEIPQVTPSQQTTTNFPSSSQQQQPSTSIDISSNILPSASSSSLSSSSAASFTTGFTMNNDGFNTAASTFGKTAKERSLSFKERKEQLIEAARRRYIERHNLDIPV